METIKIILQEIFDREFVALLFSAYVVIFFARFRGFKYLGIYTYSALILMICLIFGLILFSDKLEAGDSFLNSSVSLFSFFVFVYFFSFFFLTIKKRIIQAHPTVNIYIIEEYIYFVFFYKKYTYYEDKDGNVLENDAFTKAYKR